MFHEGDLQSGITVALQESKFVICFVTDDGQESNIWETEWLQDQNIPNVLERQAVTLRLEAGSQEARYLSVFCPVNTFPTLLVIRQGQLIDQLNGGVAKNDFTLRLLRALNRNDMPSVPQPQVSQPTPEPQTSQATPSTPENTRTETDPTTSNPTISTEPQPPNNVQTLLSERRTRLEAQQATQAALEKAKAAERSKARAQESSTPAATSEPTTAAGGRSRENYAQQQVQRKREAKQERERVLRLLENDRIERKEREERRKAQTQAERQEAGESSPLPDSSANVHEDTRPKGTSASSTRCALQVRLSNGNTIRSTFASSDKLNSAVRTWIDTTRTDGDGPYTLKQILTPLPNHTIAEAEESKSLADIDLTPSATLVLVPVKNFTPAYGGRGGGQDSVISGYILAVLVPVVNRVSSLFGLGERTETAVPMVSRPQGEVEEGTEDAGAEGRPGVGGQGGQGVRIRTLRDQRDERDDGQLYNGNQLNFEPNRPDRRTTADDEDVDAKN